MLFPNIIHIHIKSKGRILCHGMLAVIDQIIILSHRCQINTIFRGKSGYFPLGHNACRILQIGIGKPSFPFPGLFLQLSVNCDLFALRRSAKAFIFRIIGIFRFRNFIEKMPKQEDTDSHCHCHT